LWDELHVLRGESAHAAKLAIDQLIMLAKQDLQKESVRNAHGEYARIAHKASGAVVKRSPTYASAASHLRIAGWTIVDHYPVGKTEHTAQERGELWDPVYGNESAQRICAQDMLEYFQIMTYIAQSDELHLSAVGLTHYLEKIIQQQGDSERFDYIKTIKQDSFKDAIEAYEAFLQRFGLRSEVKDLDQVITLSAIMFGRALDHADAKAVALSLNTIRAAVMQQRSLLGFAVGQLKKNFSYERRQIGLNKKLSSWSEAAKNDDAFLALVKELESLRFLGTGKKNVIPLRPDEGLT
jgi:hypothetical protein